MNCFDCPRFHESFYTIIAHLVLANISLNRFAVDGGRVSSFYCSFGVPTSALWLVTLARTRAVGLSEVERERARRRDGKDFID